MGTINTRLGTQIVNQGMPSRHLRMRSQDEIMPGVSAASPKGRKGVGEAGRGSVMENPRAKPFCSMLGALLQTAKRTGGARLGTGHLQRGMQVCIHSPAHKAVSVHAENLNLSKDHKSQLISPGAACALRHSNRACAAFIP